MKQYNKRDTDAFRTSIDLTWINTPSNDLLKQYKLDITTKGFADITNCFSLSNREMLSHEVFRVFDKNCERKDFISSHTDTPRSMYTVSETKLSQDSLLIKSIHYSKNLLELLSTIANEELYYLSFVGERYLINGLRNSTDTHGWHWDDYAYALIFIADCPNDESGGGLLECIPHTTWDRQNNNIQEILNTREKQTYYFPKGTVYFMRSDTTLHRVSPITEGHTRTTLVLSYQNNDDFSKNIDHSTVMDLYGDVKSY